MAKKDMVCRLLPFNQSGVLEAGVDEAGRGCYAGPVVAAAVILPPDFYHPLLNDSKLLKASDRYALRTIIEKEAIAYSYAFVPPDEIDKINILQATYVAMHQSITTLSVQPEFLLIDGNRFKPYGEVSYSCFVKGDGRFASIAAASILAKTYRDDYMKSLHPNYPYYGWDQNKGYGTLVHRQAIEQYGLCEHHRKSFAIGANQHQLSLFND